MDARYARHFEKHYTTKTLYRSLTKDEPPLLANSLGWSCSDRTSKPKPPALATTAGTGGIRYPTGRTLYGCMTNLSVYTFSPAVMFTT
jgi:hypothetical protein